MNSKNLVETLDHVNLFDKTSRKGIKRRSYYRFPYIKWPNNTPCHIANMYIIELSKRHQLISNDNRRQDSKGGTLGQYASHISQLIRCCWIHQTDPFHISDKFFSDFIQNLIEEKHHLHPERNKRSDTSTINIGRVCLGFLRWVGIFYGDPNFVSPSGTIRTSTQKIRRTYNGHIKEIETESHHSFPLPYREHTRSPIPEHNITKIEQAADRIARTKFLNTRHRALVDLLQHTGARRAEIASLTLSAITDSQLMIHPMLNLVTVKRGQKFIREIPINALALNWVKKYLGQRFELSKKFPGSKNQFLFISETTGNPLAIETVTSTMSKLRKAAAIPEQACAHMFRHAFITNLFTLLVERHKFQSKDEFEAALINDKVFLKLVQGWTGHKSIDSLRTYIATAFDSPEAAENAAHSVHQTRTLEIYQKQADALYNEFKNGSISAEEYIRESDELQALRDIELKRYGDAP